MPLKSRVLMKIVRITAYTFGGAAKSIFELHNSMIAKGVDEHVIISSGSETETIHVHPEDSYHWSNIWIFRKIQAALCKMHIWPRVEHYKNKANKLTSRERAFITLPVTNFKSLCENRYIQEADIVNLHWIGGFVDYPTFFKHVKKPIVLTLHDENHFRGILHYSNESNEVQKFDKEMLKIKRKALEHSDNIHVVTQSSYLRNICKKSELLGKYPITVVGNGVNENQFKPINKIEARSALGLPNNALVFSFVATYIEDERKGLRKLINSLERLNQKAMLLCVGKYTKIPQTSIEVKCFGVIDDSFLLSLVYSSSDIFVMPSSFESFAKTPLEAMACGTPVVAFPCSGIADCLNEKTGVICKDFTEEALLEGIKKAITIKYDNNNIRKYCVSNFTFDLLAERYIQLYASILKN